MSGMRGRLDIEIAAAAVAAFEGAGGAGYRCLLQGFWGLLAFYLYTISHMIRNQCEKR